MSTTDRPEQGKTKMKSIRWIMSVLAVVIFGLSGCGGANSATENDTKVSIRIVSGDMQTIVQHSLLPLPLRVVVTDERGNPVPDMKVTFSAASGSGYILPAVVLSDSNGEARWSGYLHTAGLQKVDATVENLATVTFAANVTATSYQYNGSYHCTSFEMTIADGKASLNGPIGTSWTTEGTLNETDGVLSAYLRISNSCRLTISGLLMVDSLQQATGAGISSDNVTCGSPSGMEGEWTCNRL